MPEGKRRSRKRDVKALLGKVKFSFDPTVLRKRDRERVARIPAESLDELVKTITDANRHGETPTGRRRGREAW